MKIRYALVFMILCHVQFAFGYSWKLSILYPDSETKEFIVPEEKPFFLKMPDSKWECVIGPPNEKGKITVRVLACVKGNDEVGVNVLCMNGQFLPGDLLISENIHSKKTKTHTLALRCD